MSSISFENFGKLASTQLSPTERAGRYRIQVEAEKLVVADVISKLGLNDQDDLLDVGCGTGLLLLPLSLIVRSATGIDHAAVIDSLHRSFPGASVATIPGSFLEISIEAKFSAIVAYSVVHYLSSEDELFAFVEKAAGLLDFGGRLLIGDIPNVDRKRRFLQTQTGAEFGEAWKERTSASAPPSNQLALTPDPSMLEFGDELVVDLIARFRRQGFDTFVLPQSTSLPFGHTREDILVTRPPR